jgi:hypothetical protein
MVAGWALADAYRGRRGGPCGMAIRCGCRLDEHIFRCPRVPVALAGVVRARDQHAGVREEPRPHVSRFQPKRPPRQRVSSNCLIRHSAFSTSRVNLYCDRTREHYSSPGFWARGYAEGKGAETDCHNARLSLAMSAANRSSIIELVHAT